ncbi:MAG: SAP domain-containing protein [bacterium]|nr:SAP domain-containing protein [bacterium]
MPNFNEIRAMVKARGIKQPPGASRVELVRLLQLSEGNFDCFATAVDGVCDQIDCVWREDCFKSVGVLK